MNKMPLKKRIENFWFYYKIHTIVAVIVIISLSVLITQCCNRVTPDMTIIIASGNVNFTDEQQDALEAKLSQYTEDLNNDGQKVVDIENFYISNNAGDSQLNSARQQKFSALLASSDATIYLLDDTFYNSLESSGDFACDLSLISSNIESTKSIKVSQLSDFDIKDMPETLKDLHFTVRNFANKAPTENKSTSIQNSVAAAKKILANYKSAN